MKSQIDEYSPCRFANIQVPIDQENSVFLNQETPKHRKIIIPLSRKLVQQREERQEEKIEKRIELPKHIGFCNNTSLTKIEQIQSQLNQKYSKYSLELSIESTQQQENESKDMYYQKMVELYESSANFGLKTIIVDYGRKGLVQRIELLNYQTCKVRLAKLCELCQCNDKNMKRLYMIPSGSRIRFLHAFCVYNSSGFKVCTEQRKIQNLEEEMRNLASKLCSLCYRPYASLQCAGNDKESCEVRFHANCLFNRKELGQVKEGPEIFCSKHKDKQQTKPKTLDNCSKPTKKQVKIDNQLSINQLSIPSRVQQIIQSAENQIMDDRVWENSNRQEFLAKLDQEFGSMIAVSITNKQITNIKQE